MMSEDGGRDWKLFLTEVALWEGNGEKSYFSYTVLDFKFI